MNSLREEYENVSEKVKSIASEIEELRNNEMVKRYVYLKEQSERLCREKNNLYKEIKEMEYSDCNHIFVYSEIDYDRWECRTHKRRGCIKCGLDESVYYGNLDYLFLTDDEKIMYNYLKSNRFYGIETDVICDLDLAKAICSKIRKVYPDIDDKTLIKYFEIALDDIRNIKVSAERRENRAKRLLLKPSFRNWYVKDVYDEY